MMRKRKGVTLAEMCIVMAVISIVSLSVVSFVTITSGRGSASAAKLDVMEELELVESIVDSWFTMNAKDGIQLNPKGSINMHGRTLEVGFADDRLMSYSLEKVTDIEFAIEKRTQKDESGNEIVMDTLYFCTVTYEQEDGAPEQTYIFCINPRVGEVVEEMPTEESTEKPTEGPTEEDPTEETPTEEDPTEEDPTEEDPTEEDPTGESAEEDTELDAGQS